MTDPDASSACDEFGLIKQFFTQPGETPSVWSSQGQGDDCAFLDAPGVRIAVTADMMALGTHFPDNASAYSIGRKALAVNLSDLAAAGATPQAFFLSIALARADQQWLAEFSRGLFEEAERFACPLRGGDTIKAAAKTSIAITALGSLAPQTGLTRRGAQAGDDIWVSGTPGDAYIGLMHAFDKIDLSASAARYFEERLSLPEPRVALGQKLLGLASACCDVSDGLCQDLGHILEMSKVSACLWWEDLPQSDHLRQLPLAWRQKAVLSGGDDYELLFTASSQHRQAIDALQSSCGCVLSRIGVIEPAGSDLVVLDAAAKPIKWAKGFQHFHGRSK